jgi:hypothetical protein
MAGEDSSDFHVGRIIMHSSVGAGSDRPREHENPSLPTRADEVRPYTSRNPRDRHAPTPCGTRKFVRTYTILVPVESSLAISARKKKKAQNCSFRLR